MKNIVSLRNLALENKKFRNPSMRETIFFFLYKREDFCQTSQIK